MPEPTARLKARLLNFLLIGAELGLAGCQSLEQIAPPVAVVSMQPNDKLRLGRDLYVTKCAKCHAPEPILKYSASKWEEIVADMAEETKLTDHETAAVREYVMAVLSHAGGGRYSRQ